MKIKRAIESVPGGMMLVPLMCGAVINTAAPAAATYFGSFTSGLFSGSISILAVFYVCMGATIPVRSLPSIARRGGVLMLTKIMLGLIAGFVLGHFLGVGAVSSGCFAGVSALAVVVAINNTNGGLYMALMSQYGTAEEAASYSVMALESGPFFTMITLGIAGLSSFPWQTLVGAILPLFAGMLLGNLDGELKKFFSQATPVLIPFFAFSLGATIDLRRIWQAGIAGILLGGLVLIVSAAVLIAVDKGVGGTGTAGMAAATTAGNAAAVPSLIAVADPRYAPVAASATVLVAASMVIGSLAVPPLTAWWHGRTCRTRSL